MRNCIGYGANEGRCENQTVEGGHLLLCPVCEENERIQDEIMRKAAIGVLEELTYNEIINNIRKQLYAN